MHSLRRFWRSLLAAAEAFLFYPYCVLCEERLADSSRLVCDSCLAGLPRADPAILEKGALRELPNLAVFERIASLWLYSDEVERLIHLLKYQRKPALADPIAGKLASLAEELASRAGAESVLVPVPLHRVRLRERGFNQSALLAEQVAARTGLTVAADSLKRVRYTRSQARLTRTERLRNVVGAFRVSSAVQIAGKHCVLVDDVVTTGATSSACGKELLRAGAQSVSLLTAARA